jgi:hypothetical protein
MINLLVQAMDKRHVFSYMKTLFFYIFGGILNLRRLVSWQACTKCVGVERTLAVIWHS